MDYVKSYKIMSKFSNEDFYKQLAKYDDLSYRRYKRLDDKSKETLEQYALLPDELNHVLKLFHYIKKEYNMPGVDIRFAVNLLNFTYSEFTKFYSFKYQSKKPIPEDKLLSELKFRGFVKLRKVKLEQDSAYIICRRRLEGDIYIHPHRMSNGNSTDLPYIYNHMEKIMIPGGDCQLLSNCINTSYLPKFTDKELKKIRKELQILK